MFRLVNKGRKTNLHPKLWYHKTVLLHHPMLIEKSYILPSRAADTGEARGVSSGTGLQV